MLSRKPTRALLLLFILSVGAGASLGQQQGAPPSGPPKLPTIFDVAKADSAPREMEIYKTINSPLIRTIDALADVSDAVVLGRVVTAHAIPCDESTFICTNFRVKVQKVLWGRVPSDRRGRDHLPVVVDKRTGRPADAKTPEDDRVIRETEPALDELVVNQPGGSLVIDGHKVIAKISDQAVLQQGQEYVLFLHWVPGSAPTMWSGETYELYGGSQSIIEVHDGRIRDLVWDPTHSIKADLERSFDNDLRRLISHFAERNSQKQ